MAKLFRRGKIWHAWVAQPEGGSARVSTGCTDRRAAEARLAHLERCSVDPAYAAASQATTQRILDDYYASRVRLGRADGTLHHVGVKAGHLLRLLPSSAPSIDHAACTRYVDARLEEGARRTTICKELRVLGAAWRLALRNELVTRPVDSILPELDDDGRAIERWLTPWELVALATVLEPRRMAVAAFACATGCDPGALWRARRQDVAPGEASVLIRGTKRASRHRLVPLVLEEQRVLVRWALARASREGLLFAPWGNIRRDLHLACAKIGVPGCSPNDLRRTFAQTLRRRGVEPQLIGAAMGHADGRQVERVYGRLAPEALAKLLTERVAEPAVPVLPVCCDTVDQGASGAPPAASPESPSSPIPVESSCAGTESNRRHGDFQSSNRDRRKRLYPPRISAIASSCDAPSVLYTCAYYAALTPYAVAPALAARAALEARP